LGNNRVVVKGNSEVVQRTDYYASGLPFPGMLNPEEQQFKYNGKEFDTMHGLNWYDMGNRMLDPQIMRYHVPDRFCEKFPWQSPYVQAANNPMRYVDFMGDSIMFVGTQAQDAFSQTQAAISNELALNMQSNGTITATQTAMGPLTYASSQILEAANSNSVTVVITSENTTTTSEGNLYIGGAFMGNTVSTTNGIVTAVANQEVNPNVLGSMSTAHGKPGADMLHEITEAYQGAIISIRQGISSPREGQPGSVYNQAHSSASSQSGPIFEIIYDRFGNVLNMAPNNQYPKNTASAQWHVIDTNGNQKVIQKLGWFK
jgi:RHS repeat-associated protein